MRFVLAPLRKLHLKRAAVQVDETQMINTRKNRVTKRFGNIFCMCRVGCQVQICNSPVIDDKIHPLRLEQLEILNNIALLKDGLTNMIDSKCENDAALIYQLWARLQIQALYKRFDEIKEIDFDDVYSAALAGERHS
ncbi:MAG: hypothetical protein SGBAC_001749 [Bacillariaceae sp.]